MSIVILGGIAKGFRLKVPESEHLRPTSIMLRRKVFDWNQSLEGWIFVDLCAGTGAMAFEAASRGAREIWLNEKDRKHFKFLEQSAIKFKDKFEHLGALHLSEKPFEVFVKSFFNHYEKWDEEKKKGVILFFDPPYENHEMYKTFLRCLKESFFKGQIWIESDVRKGLPVHWFEQNLTMNYKLFSQGDHFLFIC